MERTPTGDAGGARVVYVLDARLRPVPADVVGEMYLGGDQLARGYWNQPALTAQRFVADPARPGARMYRTGDRAKPREDGVLEFAGRADRQVKIRGYRIELEEIEAVAAEHESVGSVVVVAKGHADGSPNRLVAYAVPKNGAVLDRTQLHRHLEQHLPPHMVPADVVVLERFPLTTNGKIDTRALPEPARAGGPYRAPGTSAEAVLANLYGEILGLERVGVDDDFIRLGGDSILSIALAVGARRHGLVLTQRQIFQCRTVGALAAVAISDTDAAARTAAAGELAELPQADPADLAEWRTRYPNLRAVWPLTALQFGMVFHTMAGAAETGRDAYLIQSAFRMVGDIDPPRLRAACQALLDRYPNLRAVFLPDTRGELAQLVLDNIEVPWWQADVAEADGARREQAIERLLTQDRLRPFDLTAAPLLRFGLIRIDSELHELVLTAHHALFDGWSEPILQRDLLLLYASHADPGALPEAADYRSYLTWLAARDRTASARAWQDELAGVTRPTSLAPRSASRDSAGDHETGTVEIELTASEAEAVAERAAECGITLNTAVQGAWAVVVGGLLDTTDVVFGTTVSGRPPDLAAVESMVGLLINTLPVRVTWDPEQSIAAALWNLQERQAALLDHHHHGLLDIHRATGMERLFDSLVVFESYPNDAAGLESAYARSGIKVANLRRFVGTHYPLVVGAYNEPHLRLGIQYRKDLFDPTLVEGISAGLGRVLRALIESPATPVGELPAVGDELRAILRLRAVDAVSPEFAPSEYRAPRTPREDLLCSVLAEILELDRVGIDDNFFALGGNSLHATRLIGRARRDLGVELSIRTVFEFPTVAELSQRLDHDGPSNRPALRKMVTSEDRGDIDG
ncbi:condensation domain-containing protein [Nocardia sp. NPDC050793]|uniref:condensation domain-containing protein n=1 Tax=Nocardia sp. NPDC050793 TaxID=3155159 RepID=UPI0033EA6C24